MLKADVSMNKHIAIEARGNLIELQADVCIIINHLYSIMRKDDPEKAEMFRRGIERSVTDSISPLWEALDI